VRSAAKKTAKPVGFMHMSATKSYIIGAIRAYGGDVIGDEWKGREAEAEAAVLAAPGELLPVGSCDNFDPMTGCKGHRR
jgi:hypothetical protein